MCQKRIIKYILPIKVWDEAALETNDEGKHTFQNRTLNFDWRTTVNEIFAIIKSCYFAFIGSDYFGFIKSWYILFHGTVDFRRVVPMHSAKLLHMDLLCVLCLGAGVGWCVCGLRKLWSKVVRMLQSCAVRCLARLPCCAVLCLC